MLINWSCLLTEARVATTMETKSHLVGVPVYGVSYCPQQDLLAVVGGGGSSKSGVKNFIVQSDLMSFAHPLDAL